MNFKNKRIFVSGAAGVIGNEIVPMLVNAGALVYACDIKSKPKQFVANVVYRQGDLNYITKEELEYFSPDVFIHLAATFERSTESYEFWEENFWHNVRLSNHLMSLIKDLKSVKRVVFASSYLIYEPRLYNFDLAQQSPRFLVESDPVYPRNLTGMAKFAHEIELRFLEQFKNDQFKVVCARIFRGYGKNSRDVISRWIRSLLDGETITVFRKEGIFDYIYATDTAEGLLRLALSEAEGIINLGTGKGRKVLEVLSVLKQHFPNMKYVEHESDIPFEASVANITKLEKMINWHPQYDLEKSIPEMIAFERGKQESKNVGSCFGNVLITSASKKVPLVRAVIAASRKIAGSIKVFAGDVDEKAITRYVSDSFWVMPATRNENVDSILNFCLENKIKAIIPTRDGELLFWARNKSLFLEKGILIMISSEAAVTFCLDKLKFAMDCNNAGINAIETTENIESIATNSFVVKERWGAGSLNIGLKLNRNDALLHSKKLEEPIFQSFIDGEEISVDVFFSKSGTLKGYILRKREVVVSGESQVTVVFENQKIAQEIESFLSKFKFTGHVILQAIVKDDKVNWIECNCRFGGASTLSVQSGLDSFFWFLLEAFGEEIGDYPFIPSKKPLRQVRVPSDIYFS